MNKSIWLVACILACVAVLSQAEVVVEEIVEVPVVENPQEEPEAAGAEAEEVEGAPEDTISFMNSDKLKGMLVSVDPKKDALVWQSPYSAKPIELTLESANKVFLKARSYGNKKWGSASIYLTNGDELWGDIVSLDSENLILKTWYAGVLKIHRPMVERIKIQTKDSSVFYEGPNSMSEWTVGRHGRGKSWEYKKGSLYALQQYPVAKKIKDTPDKVKIEFDMAWRGSYPGMAISFFNDNLNHQSDCYSITVSGSSIYLYRYSRNSGSSHLGNADFRSLTSGNKNSARFVILADRKDKKVALMIDGQMVRQWTDKAGVSHQGDVLMFYPQNQNGMKISNIRVCEWDGRIPEAASSEKQKTKEDLIRLANGDKVSGAIKTIGNGNLKFQASYAEMDIPLDRIVEIVCSEENRERARRNQFDARFTLANGGTVTFDLKKIQGDEASGESENFGDIVLPLSAARELECNLYAEKPDEDDEFSF